MPIVGGIDIHRRQLTYDYLDTVTGQIRTGQIRPADREHLRDWLGRHLHDGAGDRLAFEACTGWRYVAEETARADAEVLLAEPADTAAKRGRNRRAKTDKADARLLRELAERDDVPRCFVPPGHILESRALLELYHDVREQHTSWVQRIHATLFHQGAPVFEGLAEAGGHKRLEEFAAAHLSPVGQQQIEVALTLLETLDVQAGQLRRQIGATAGHLTGAKVLAGRLYGVGPATALALVCWLGGAGRFSSSRQAVRFTGLDVTVYSSAGKRSAGHLSRQGPPVLRWLLYEAAKTSARAPAPDHAYYAQVKDRIDGKRAAICEARKLTRQACHILAGLGDEAFTLV